MVASNKSAWYTRFFSRGGSASSDKLLTDKAPPRRTVLARLPSRYLVDVDPAVSVAHTYGLVRFNVHEATLDDATKGRDYFCTVSVGKQCLLSNDVVAVAPSSATLPFKATAEFVLQKGGASIARVALFRRGRLDGALRNFLVAWCEVDLASYFDAAASASASGQAGADTPTATVVVEGTFDLLDPDNPAKKLGCVHLSGSASSLKELERQVWERLLLLADWDGNGQLSLTELAILMHAFGSDMPMEELEELFHEADKDGSGSVDVEELSQVLSLGDADATGFSRRLRRCPVDGAELSPDPSQAASNLLYVWLALAATDPKESEMSAGFHTETQASRAWVLRLSEWASHPFSRGARDMRRKLHYRTGGLRVGAAAAHILVFNRADRRIEEEALSPLLSLAMRTMYQSTAGRGLMRQGLVRKLTSLSVKEGTYRNSPESVKDIKPFVESFRGQIDITEAELPLDQYKTFNEFFCRRLKPSARPVASPEDPEVLVSAADCRLQVFESVDEASRFWIKGKNFSIAGLLADTDPERPVAKAFAKGTMAIFRLAPQDYHRFHCPVDGTIVSITDVPGDLLTVNPIAVNCNFCDVFTINKRSVMLIDNPALGRVAFVAIGATLVGSINWTSSVGQTVAKGDELGYFEFGGSTCIALFPDGAVTFDADLLANGRRSLETLVKVGERIGLGSAKSAATESDEVRTRLMRRTLTLVDDAGVVPLEQRPGLQRMLSGQIDSYDSVVDGDGGDEADALDEEGVGE